MRHKRHRLVSVAALLIAAATSSPASADCTCRGPGIVARHGQTFCLKTSAGPRLARCEMVLNNSSWKFLSEACPEASRRSETRLAAMSPAPAGQLVVR